MKTDKEKIFSNIRSALQGVEKTPRPEIDYGGVFSSERVAGSDDWEAFQRNFGKVRGYTIDSVRGLAEFIQKHGLKRGYCDPAFKEVLGLPLEEYFAINYDYPRTLVDDLEFAITRASGVVAETGSIILKDRDSVNRLATVAPWMHVAVVYENQIYKTVREAILSYDNDPNIVWVTGPSKTGDIEGILIEGVHGPGEQVCYRLNNNDGE